MVEQYERLLKLGTGITMGQEGYGTPFYAATATDGDDLLAASIVDYAECVKSQRPRELFGHARDGGRTTNKHGHVHA